mmetsp:Transcript_10094/g.14497  ORF Transcript_10094/g.14497 Transcript_10094/m.14497 type:complete len:125 (-) Transcript_10094:38-412(-)
MDYYARAMVYQFDKTNNRIFGSDQAHHDYLIYTNRLVGAPNITDVIPSKLGEGPVITVGLLQKLLPENTTAILGGIVDNQTHQVLNTDGRPSPLVHMFDRVPFLKEAAQNRSLVELQKLKEKIQ